MHTASNIYSGRLIRGFLPYLQNSVKHRHQRGSKKSRLQKLYQFDHFGFVLKKVFSLANDETRFAAGNSHGYITDRFRLFLSFVIFLLCFCEEYVNR